MTLKREYFATVNKNKEKEYIINISVSGLNTFKIDIDGKKFLVDSVRINENIYSIIINGRSYAVDITEKGDCYDVMIDGDHFDIEVLDEVKRLIKHRTSSVAVGTQTLEANMPGYIWKLMVDEGQEIKEGDPLMILVAMKMENEIKSPKDGVVGKIFVKLNDTVSAGDKLATIV